MGAPDYAKDVERFDRWAKTYERSWLQWALFDRMHQGVLTLASKSVEAPGYILDIGCGTGKLLRQAASVWSQTRLIGVDPTGGMIEVAQHLSPGAAFFTASAEKLPLQDASVDLAFSTSSFHHWQDQAAGLREITRVLRPGGYFLLVDSAFPNWFVRAARLQRFHSPERLGVLFTQAGLQVQQQQTLVSWGRWLATIGKK